MTRQIAVDHAADQIVCNAIAPGKIITGKPGIANDPAAADPLIVVRYRQVLVIRTTGTKLLGSGRHLVGPGD